MGEGGDNYNHSLEIIILRRNSACEQTEPELRISCRMVLIVGLHTVFWGIGRQGYCSSTRGN